MTKHHGIVGRMVMMPVKRGDQIADEICEVVACQAVGEYGTWHILVVTSDGKLLDTGTKELRLIADPGGEGPYR